MTQCYTDKNIHDQEKYKHLLRWKAQKHGILHPMHLQKIENSDYNQ